MPERILTHAVDDQPVLHLIGVGALVEGLHQRFRSRGFFVEHEAALSEIKTLRERSKGDDPAYKQLVVLDATAADAKKTLSQLSHIDLPPARQRILVLQTITQLEEREAPYASWYEASLRQAEVQQTAATLLSSGDIDRVFSVQDLVFPSKEYATQMEPWHSLLRQHDAAATVLDPRVSLSPQLLNPLLNEMESPLFDPRGAAEVVLRGRMQSTTQLLSTLQQHARTVYDTAFDIESLQAQIIAADEAATARAAAHQLHTTTAEEAEIVQALGQAYASVFQEMREARQRAAQEVKEARSGVTEPHAPASSTPIPTLKPSPTSAQSSRETELTVSSPTASETMNSRTAASASHVVRHTVHTSQPVLHSSSKPKRYEMRQYRPAAVHSTSATVTEKTQKKTVVAETTIPDFLKKRDATPTATPPTSSSAKHQDAFPDESAIGASIQRLFQEQRVEHKTNRLVELAEETYAIVKKNRRKQILFFAGLVTTFLVLLGTALFGVMQYSTARLQTHLFAATELVASAQASTQPELDAHRESMQYWHDLLRPQVRLFSSVLPASRTTELQTIQDVVEAIETIAQHRTTLQQQSTNFYAQFTAQQTGDTFATLQLLSATAQELFQELSLLRASVDDIPLADDRAEQVNTIKRELDEASQAVISFQQVQPILPILLGREGRYTYAVLIQDEQELRPTGGFIQSVVLVKVEDGLLVDSQVFDIYQLDENEPGAVSPPTDIERFLGEDTYFLRDSNWNPDFPETAQTLERRLENVLQTEINGVIGMNIATLEHIIAATGPIDLPRYNETITDRNLRERATFHSEVTLTEDTQNFYPALTRALFAQLQTMDPTKARGLFSALYQALQQKQLLVYLENTAYLETFQTLGWTGSIYRPPCPTALQQDTCIVDPVMQVEANAGVNKANADIRREIEHTVSLSPVGIQHSRRISLQNTAQTASWPQGTYRSFLRLYANPTASLSAITIDGTPVAQEDIVIREETDRQVFGVLVEVPVQQRRTVVMQYDVPFTADTRALVQSGEGSFSYAFFDQKQPGTEDTELSIDITHADTFSPTVVAPQASVSGNTIRFDADRQDHSFVGVTFSL